MQKLVTEIKAIPGVIGACCYHSQQGLVANSLPGLFKPDRLALIGKHIARILAAGRLNFPDLNDMVLQYEETTLVGKSLDQNRVLAVLCDPGVNMNLLTMSLNLAMENFETDPQQDIEQAAPAAQPPTAPARAGLPSGEQDAIRSALAKVVGPMANLMFEDALREAQHANVQGPELTASLVAILTRDIADDDLAEQFRQLLAESEVGRK